MAGVMKGLNSLFGGGAGGSQAQAPFVLANYISSRAFVAALDADGWLRGFFSRPGLDPLAPRSGCDAGAAVALLEPPRHRGGRSPLEIVLLRVRAFRRRMPAPSPTVSSATASGC